MKRPIDSVGVLRAGAWCGALLVIAGALAPVLTHWGTHVVSPYGGIDAVMQAGLLEWSRTTLATARAADVPIFFPVTGAIAFMDSLAGQALLVAPWRWLGGSTPAGQYNLAYLATLLLAAAGMAALCRAAGGRAAAAGVAAVALVGSPYTTAQLCHLNQLPMPCVLIAMAALVGALADERPGSARRHALWWVLGAALALQAAWGWYGFAYVVIAMTTITAIWGASGLRERRAAPPGARRPIAGHFAGAVPPLLLAVLAVLFLSAPYRAMQRQHPEFERSREDVRYDSANLKHLVEGGAYRVHAADLAGRGLQGEARYRDRDRQVLHFGWVAAALAAYGFVRRRAMSRRELRAGYALLAAGAAGLVLAFGESIGLPGSDLRLSLPFDWLREMVPAFKAYRAVWRFSFLAVVAVAWWAGTGWNLLLGPATRGRLALAALALGLLVVESVPRGLPASPLAFDGALKPLVALPPGALLSLPAPRTEYDEDVTEARWLLWALESGRAVTGGVSGWVPPGTRSLREDLHRCEQGALDAAVLLARARADGLAGAVVVARPGDDRRVAYWHSQLAAFGAVPVSSPRHGYAVYSFGEKPPYP